ncbi:Amidase enhancer [Luteimicrobium xylanilyticum]|uniref:Amidase enhancer n=1 Tax=Luteimicrobium xylanilyticum TaxID=1133546 RepID=A0A5P9QCU0_9MICO|nr:SpoIID/LytB domain-containing protein [Luteimicrobium xylanilyticum]QFU99046.1 Amidase enhancer [Luteimicrobium xylanilyticum]
MTSTTGPSGVRAGHLRATLASVLTALAVVVGSVGLAAPAQAAATHVALTGHSSAWSDQKTTLTATWTLGSKAHKGKVTLQRKSGKTWKKVATKTTTSKGVAKFSVKPASTTTYRVLTSSKKASKAKKLTVTKAYALASTAGSTITAGTGKTFTLTYHHHGRAASATALVERHSGSKWVKVASVKVSKGHGKVTLKPSATTTYRFRVPGKVTSASHKVTVKAPSTFSITGSGSGHGVGLSQYGAYQMALEGKSGAQILTHFYTGTTVGNVTTPERIKVQVWGPEPYSYPAGTYSDTAKTTTITFGGPWHLTADDALTTVLDGSAAQDLRISVVNGKLTFALLNGSIATPPVTASSSASSYEVHWDSGTAAVKGSQGLYHNGWFDVTAIGTRPNIVNDVLLNTEYLYGIAEMPSSWGAGKGKAALEAQAVIARTYALSKVGSLNPKCNCDVVDDVRDQNYTGWKKQDEGQHGSYGDLWVSAVNATVANASSAQVVTYRGEPIQTPYFAASGGHTANNEDVWQGTNASGPLPYLRSQPDPAKTNGSRTHNPYVSWTRSITQAQAKKIFSYASTPLTDVKSISVSDRYPTDTGEHDGQVRELKGTSADGTTATVTASADWWRTTLGLPAAWVTSFTPKK